jgi:citrate synthase
MADAINKGLAGVVAGSTRKSLVDGEQGRLYYAGYPIADLAVKATFEEVAYLLWNDKLPTQAQLNELSAQLKAEYSVPAEVLQIMQGLPTSTHPMSALRTAVSLLGNYDPEADDNSVAANRRKAIRLTAKVPTLTAAWARIRKGQAPVAPRSDLSIAANFVYMFNNRDPHPTETEAVDAYLILLADHGFNASTFTARAVTSTDADMYSAMVAAIGSLKGAKHGGANEAAMNMFLEVKEVDNVTNFFENEIKGKGRKIMGIGHRVYKTLDPRARVLRERAEAMAKGTGNDKWFQIADQLATLARDDEYFVDRRLYPNVDYFSAIVLYTLDIPVDFFTPLFAMSRMPGWSSHVIEQWEDNPLVRPDVQYTGPIDLPWVPISDRN